MARYVDIGRETKDLDFAIQRFSNEISVLQKTFEDIVQIQVDDGFVFTNPVVAPLKHFHMQYPGAHVKIEVRFGKAKFPLFIDLGFGDLVPCAREGTFASFKFPGTVVRTIANCEVLPDGICVCRKA